MDDFSFREMAAVRKLAAEKPLREAEAASTAAALERIEASLARIEDLLRQLVGR